MIVETVHDDLSEPFVFGSKFRQQKPPRQPHNEPAILEKTQSLNTTIVAPGPIGNTQLMTA